MTKNQQSHKNTFLQWIIDVDYRSAIWFYNLNPKLTTPLKIISLLGTIQFWAILSVIFLIFGALFDQNLENLSILMFMGIVISLLTITVIKVSVKRKRPYQDEKLRRFRTSSQLKIENLIFLKRNNRFLQVICSTGLWNWYFSIIFLAHGSSSHS